MIYHIERLGAYGKQDRWYSFLTRRPSETSWIDKVTVSGWHICGEFTSLESAIQACNETRARTAVRLSTEPTSYTLQPLWLRIVDKNGIVVWTDEALTNPTAISEMIGEKAVVRG